MGFDEVHRSLLQLFPHIDARALRAVAIDHCKDVDAAVLAVLDEIIPFLERSTPSGTPLNQSVCVADSGPSSSGSIVGAETEDDPPANTTGPDGLRIDHDVIFGRNEHFCNAYDGHHGGDDNSSAGMMRTSASVQSCGEPVVGNDLISGDQFSDDIIDVQDLDTGACQIGNPIQEVEGIAGHLQIDYGNKESDATKGPSESCVSLNESTVSESSEVRIVDLVVESTQEARDNMETLSTSMESVISLMRQVQLKEQAAEQAKVDAGLCGKNTLDNVEELKRMLQYAKAANDMHVGEVYGEKAILGTELGELQYRVLSMSDERDKSLSVLDEMRLTLEVRLEAAENEIRSAEHEKLEKENAARKLIADQELFMEKVVQESKILKQQSEDNAKLLEFLVDGGRVVDMLEGELRVICQDIRVLKEKFDERVPLSKSPFSSFISLNMDQVGSVRVCDFVLLDNTKN